ncbi:MAG: hypothetical protein ACREQA_11080 [Candidatus Binatia bacterium]
MLFINNEEVAKLLTIEDTLGALEEGHKELARGELAGRPRVDIYTETHASDRFHRWGTMEGSSKSLQRFAIRMKSEDSVKGLQFVTVSSLVYDLAKKAGLGRDVPLEWFLQDIRD